MRVAGGVIATVVGAIMIIWQSISAFVTGGVATLAESGSEVAGRGTEVGAGAGNLAQLATTGMVWAYLFLAVGIATFILGVVVTTQVKRGATMMLAALGAGTLAIAIAVTGGMLDFLFGLFVLIGGALAYFGTQQGAR